MVEMPGVEPGSNMVPNNFNERTTKVAESFDINKYLFVIFIEYFVYDPPFI